MTEEPWHKRTPGDPMPCKCGDSVMEVRLHSGDRDTRPAIDWDWGCIPLGPEDEITDWRFVERKGEDVIAADPYDGLEWDEDGIATVVLKVPGRPEWVRDDDHVEQGDFFARLHPQHMQMTQHIIGQFKHKAGA